MNTTIDATKNCGSCKWLVVEAKDITKKMVVHARYKYSAFRCDVPFTLPPFPACYDVRITEKRYSCPYHGENCAFHERRTELPNTVIDRGS